MKKTIILIHLTFCTLMIAQVAIGKTNVTNASVSLEFAENMPKGIILPYVENLSNIKENGTFIFDANEFKIKFLNDNKWIDFTKSSDGKADLSIQNSKRESAVASTIIGLDNTVLTSILRLSDEDKAMILPKVEEPHLNIINPAPGMMVYDSKNKKVAFFNGSTWSFWMPKKKY